MTLPEQLPTSPGQAGDSREGMGAVIWLAVGVAMIVIGILVVNWLT
jgi:hypothetical protein